MNYRIGDIIEVMIDGKKTTGKICGFKNRPLCAIVLICVDNIGRNVSGISSSWFNNGYDTKSFDVKDILRVIKRKRGSANKKKYEMILIDEDGNIVYK